MRGGRIGVLAYDALRTSRPLRRGVRVVKRGARRTLERAGSDRWSHPSPLDHRLAEYLPGEGGVFVEAGAYDGYLESTTYWLERFRKWSGVLVEPVPELAERARRERPGSLVFECALVPFDFAGETVEMWYGGTMSVVEGGCGAVADDERHALLGARLSREHVKRLTVPAKPLSALLDEAGLVEVDLLSLDVEGYEARALRGLDLTRHAPRFILVEMLDPARQRDEIEAAVGAAYVHEAQLSDRDHLYRRAA
jgi:FkbM family methyltransferase